MTTPTTSVPTVSSTSTPPPTTPLCETQPPTTTPPYGMLIVIGFSMAIDCISPLLLSQF